MGKKRSKRRTRWKTLPLSGEDGASGSEDDLSTTSSGRGQSLVLRMRDRPYRYMRRLSDREPLVKLENKTFDEEEYTKITTPRQDVLFKKGHFGRKKLESSIEDGIHISHCVDAEEGAMEPVIITNGFVDERGHYLVNGTSYEIYDPYTNTVTVVMGPPPYTNGVTAPVLAAVSCQPVPLQPVDWIPQGQGDWPLGPAWAPAYPKCPETTDVEPPTSPVTGEEQAPPIYPNPPFIFSSLLYPVHYDVNAVAEENVVSTVDEKPEEGDGVPQANNLSPNSDPNQKTSDDGEPPTCTPLKPPATEFVPSTVLKPPTKEFVPSMPLRPPTTEFVPKTFRPNGFVYTQPPPFFVPPTPMPIPTPQTLMPTPPQEPSISEQNIEEPKMENVASSPEAPKVATPPQVTTETGLQTPESIKCPTPEPVDPVRTPTPIQTINTPVAEPKPADVDSHTESAPTTPKRESHGTQTPPEMIATPEKKVPPPPPASPRRSYAKTVSNGLDIRTNGKTPEDTKKTIENAVILTNGHEDRLSVSDKEAAKNVKNHRGRNGYKDNNGESYVNGNGKERSVNGKDKARRDPKERREINNQDAHNGKPMQNGYKHVNGKERTIKPKPEKKPLNLHIQIDKPDLKNGVEDSDSDQFTQVEHRRGRTLHNGFTRVKHNSPQTREPQKEEPKPSPKSDSDKSSTISELSSPAELSSGQTTPPDLRQVDRQNELNQSVERLREGLEEHNREVSEEEVKEEGKGKGRKSSRKNRKGSNSRRVEVKESKEEVQYEEPPPLPEFLQPPKDDLMDLNLEQALDHDLLKSLRLSEPAICKVNLFPPRVPIFPSDLYARTNLGQMRISRPEQVFASIVETPSVTGEVFRPRSKEKSVIPTVTLRKPMTTAYKPSKKTVKEDEAQKEDKPEAKLGIVDAVKTWLESQEDALLPEDSEEPKNVERNPSRAPSVDKEMAARVADSPDLAALTDARQSVNKYYNLSVRRNSKASETSDVSELEAVDALEYAFPRPPALAPITSGFPAKDLACKLQ